MGDTPTQLGKGRGSWRAVVPPTQRPNELKGLRSSLYLCQLPGLLGQLVRLRQRTPKGGQPPFWGARDPGAPFIAGFVKSLPDIFVRTAPPIHPFNLRYSFPRKFSPV
jgi:hypothetical protein